MRQQSVQSQSAKLDSVLPEYKKASEMGDWPEAEKNKKYKTIDSNDVVWLITNPCTWPVTYDGKGITTVHRPKPERIGDISDLKKSGYSPIPGDESSPQMELLEGF